MSLNKIWADIIFRENMIMGNTNHTDIAFLVFSTLLMFSAIIMHCSKYHEGTVHLKGHQRSERWSPYTPYI
jgi:hypothetical protein